MLRGCHALYGDNLGEWLDFFFYVEKDFNTQTQKVIELQVNLYANECKWNKKTIYSVGKILALELDHDHEDVTRRNQLFVLD